MSALEIPRLRMIDDDQAARFRRDGFLVIESVLGEEDVALLQSRFPLLFAGKFDTGIYPDEWYWREELSRPDVTRHMANAWKADLAVARLSLSEAIGEAAARLAGWPGARLGQDTIWWKPPGGKTIAYHQDTSFMDFLNPAQTMTFWFALDDVSKVNGTLEYARGSHHWPCVPLPSEFHAADDYRAQLEAAAAAAGQAVPDIFYVEVPAGSVVIHAGETWHGSGPNSTEGRMRPSIGVHLVRSDAEFSERDGGYIYRRYQLTGDRRLDESFFPVLWSEDGRRTSWIEGYCATGKRVGTAPGRRAA